MRYVVTVVVAFIVVFLFSPTTPLAQTQAPTKPPETVYLLRPAHIFDGESAQLQDSWVVLVRGEKIEVVCAGDPAAGAVFADKRTGVAGRNRRVRGPHSTVAGTDPAAGVVCENDKSQITNHR